MSMDYLAFGISYNMKYIMLTDFTVPLVMICIKSLVQKQTKIVSFSRTSFDMSRRIFLLIQYIIVSGKNVKSDLMAIISEPVPLPRCLAFLFKLWTIPIVSVKTKTKFFE